jgi:hypothetical protein
MAVTHDEYTFPDEAENNKAEPELEISVEGDVDLEVVDDTPEKDRGRKALAQDPEDANDEELSQYSTKVQNRIKELSHARHDERRAKETVLREREELERVAHRLVEENKKLKQYVNTGEQAYAGSMKSAAEAEYEMAKRQFKEAHEAFDSDAMIEAQSALTTAQLKIERANNFKPTPLQEENTVVQPQVTEQAPARPDDKTLRWQARNQWFGEDDEMTAVALVLHKKLVQSGTDPRSDEYFKQIDTRMKSRFPEFFGEPRSEDDDKGAETKRSATVVAPASRSNGTRKITLSKTQVAIARKLGVPLELYAKQLAAQESA